MELNYKIIGIDIYKDLNKQQAINLANEYNIKLLTYNDDETLTSIRHKLSITKHIFQKALKQPNLGQALTDLFYNRELHDKDKQKYPELEDYASIIEPLYDPVDSPTTQTEINPSHKPSSQPLTSLDYLQPSVNNPDYRTYDNKLIVQHEHLLSQTSANMESQKMEENLPLIKAGTFSGLSSEDVHEFLHKFNTASKCNYWTLQTKIDLFPTHLTGIPYKWFHLYQQQHPTINWDDLQTAFTKAFSSVALIEDLQSVLENRNQGDLESPLHFFYDIMHLCKRIDPNISDKKIIEYVIQGVLPDICNEIIKMENTTLSDLEQNLYKIETQNLWREKNKNRYQSQRLSTSYNSTFMKDTREKVPYQSRSEHDENIQTATANLQREINGLKHTLATLNMSPNASRNTHNAPTYRNNTYHRDSDIHTHQQQKYRKNKPHDLQNPNYNTTYNYPSANQPVDRSIFYRYPNTFPSTYNNR